MKVQPSKVGLLGVFKFKDVLSIKRTDAAWCLQYYNENKLQSTKVTCK